MRPSLSSPDFAISDCMGNKIEGEKPYVNVLITSFPTTWEELGSCLISNQWALDLSLWKIKLMYVVTLASVPAYAEDHTETSAKICGNRHKPLILSLIVIVIHSFLSCLNCLKKGRREQSLEIFFLNGKPLILYSELCIHCWWNFATYAK